MTTLSASSRSPCETRRAGPIGCSSGSCPIDTSISVAQPSDPSKSLTSPWEFSCWPSRVTCVLAQTRSSEPAGRDPAAPGYGSNECGIEETTTGLAHLDEQRRATPRVVGGPAMRWCNLREPEEKMHVQSWVTRSCEGPAIVPHSGKQQHHNSIKLRGWTRNPKALGSLLPKENFVPQN